MTFTYTAGLATFLNDVREMIGDVDTTDQLLADETINRVLTQQTVKTLAASACCMFICGRLARAVSKATGTTKFELQQQFDHFMALGKELKASGAADLPGQTPTVVNVITGLSKADQTSMLENDDFRPHGIQSGQDNFPGNPRFNHDDSDTFGPFTGS